MKKEMFVLALALCSSGVARAGDVVSDESPRFAAAPAEKSNSGVAATVNNEKILLSDVDRMVNAVRSSKPELNADLPEAKAAVETIRQKILDNLIERRLLVQEARRRKIMPSAADIAKGMTALRGDLTSDAEFAKALAKEGRTLADMKQFVIDELAVRELATRLTSDITISDAEIKAFFDAHPANWEIPATARAHHILLAFKSNGKPTTTPSEKEKAEARKRALDVLKRVQAKDADWDAIARKYSDDGSAATGGDLGEFSREQMVQPFADAVWDAKIGAITGPVETPYGFHIIRVDDRQPAGSVKLTEVSDQIKVYLLQQKNEARLNQQIKALRSTATIKKFI